MQPSYVLLPATSYPKTVGGMCYVIIVLTLIGLKQPLATSQSQAREARHAIPACRCRQAIPLCSCPITGQGNQSHYPSIHSVDKLSQHAVTQSQAREARHAIPACIVQTSYPSMQSPNHRTGKPDMLSQHA